MREVEVFPKELLEGKKEKKRGKGRDKVEKTRGRKGSVVKYDRESTENRGRSKRTCHLEKKKNNESSEKVTGKIKIN